MSLDYLGALTDDSIDYDYGERLVNLMFNQYVSLGSPQEFSGQAKTLWDAYQSAKVGTFGSKWLSASKMKNLGVDAQRLLLDMQRVYPGKVAITVPGATVSSSPTAPPTMPQQKPPSGQTGPDRPPSAPPPAPEEKSSISSALIIGSGVAVVGTIAYYVTRGMR